MRASNIPGCVVLVCCALVAPTAFADDCSTAIDDRLKKLALGAYMSGDIERMKEAEVRISRIKEARSRQSDCDVLSQIEVLDPLATKNVACERDGYVTSHSGTPVDWEKAGIDLAR